MGERGTYLVLKAGKCITVIARERSQKKNEYKAEARWAMPRFWMLCDVHQSICLKFCFYKLKR